MKTAQFEDVNTLWDKIDFLTEVMGQDGVIEALVKGMGTNLGHELVDSIIQDHGLKQQNDVDDVWDDEGFDDDLSLGEY